MIESIQAYFDKLLNKNIDDESHKSTSIELATAVLMIEISLADDHIDKEERRVIKELLLDTFSLNSEEIAELISLAEKEVDHAVSLYEFTRLLNDSFDACQKTEIINNLWRVAYADSVVDKYEEYYIRKVADLLYVPHSDYIKAKHEATN